LHASGFPSWYQIPVLGILLFHFSLTTSPDNDKCFALKPLIFGDGNADREKQLIWSSGGG
jgi:hypothetical protein